MLLEENVKVDDAVECVYDEGDDTGLRSRQDFYGVCPRIVLRYTLHKPTVVLL